MNRKERKASGVKGKKGDKAVIDQAVGLARQLQEKNKKQEALALYQQILGFDPDNIPALLDLGIASYMNGKLDAAEGMFSKILRLDAKNVGGLIMLACMRMDQNRVEEALDLVQKAERQNPPKTLLTRMGILYRDAGKLERALAYINAALADNPQDLTALYTLQTLKKYDENELKVLEGISEKKDITLEDNIRVKFALGVASIDNKKTDQAFWYFAEANLLKRATYKFPLYQIEKYFKSIATLFTPELIQRLRGTIKNKGGNQIFIIGMPRSGSTLVDQILSSHPEVTSVGESKFMGQCIPVYKNAEVPDYFRDDVPSITQQFLDDLNAETLGQIGDKYLAFIAPFTKQQKIVADKMLFNFLWVGILRLALPDCKIIHCMRDPIDIGLSIWQLLFSDEVPWAYDQKEIGRYYLAYAQLMDHWRTVFPGEFLDVHYEDVVADQEGQSRRILEFCGLSWNEDVLKFYESKRQVKTASVTQVRKPIYKDSVKKWKKYEKHLKALIETVEAGPVDHLATPST